MTTFITIHAIHSLPTGLANRGADGLAKTATIGGVPRQRVSSQCIKSHLRDHAAISALASSLDQPLSIRSALIAERKIAPALMPVGTAEPDAAALELANALMDVLFRGEQTETKKTAKGTKSKSSAASAESDGNGENSKKENAVAADRSRQILVLGHAEVEAIICIAKAVRAAGIKPDALATAFKKPPTAIADAVVALRALRHHAGLDGALFGRMATSSVVSGVDGAVAIGPWLSVHPIQSTTDFFSAQDGLLEPHEMGTAHIGTAELCGGVFYGSTLIDVARLRANLGLDDVSAAVAAVVEAVLSVDPSAKRGSTGAPGEMVEAVIEIGNAAPLSAMSAFERPCAAISDVAAEVLRGHIRARQARLTVRQRPRVALVLSEIIAAGGTLDDLIGRAAAEAMPPVALAAAAE